MNGIRVYSEKKQFSILLTPIESDKNINFSIFKVVEFDHNFEKAAETGFSGSFSYSKCFELEVRSVSGGVHFCDGDDLVEIGKLVNKVQGMLKKGEIPELR